MDKEKRFESLLDENEASRLHHISEEIQKFLSSTLEKGLKAKKCERFCNYHCSTEDCPNIQCDVCDEKWGYGIAEDIGLERIECNECEYYNPRCTCDDCYFQGSKECPESKGEKEDG